MEYMAAALEIVEKVWSIGAAAVEWLDSKEMLDEEVEKLRKKVNMLSDREKDVKTELIALGLDHQCGKKRKREVENWLENVKIKKIEVEQRLETATRSTYMTHWRHRRLIQKDIEEVTELFDQGGFSEGLSIVVRPPKFKRNVPSMVLDSDSKKIEMIWDHLMNGQTLVICVVGMVGVGKSTIVAHVNNRLLSNNSFDHVFWVSVGRESSIYNLQNSIAEAAGLDLSMEEEQWKRAAMLSKCLESKKFVLILDDVWEIFQPQEVGIPLGDNIGKLLLTTRKFDVCRGLRCQEIEISRLSDGEAFDLFLEELGSGKDLSPEMEEYARSVAKECAGVPLAIVSVARSMRGEEEISGWRNALNELQDPTMEHVKNRPEMFKQFKFSYDHLGDEVLQQCLLYCALFSGDWEIERDELIAYWVGEGLIGSRLKNRQAQFDKGNYIIKRLTDACLLETPKHMIGKSFIKMNDAVRNMALAIASENPLFMVKAGAKLTTLPSQQEWLEKLDRVSLMHNEIEGHCRLLKPNCPTLKTLLLQHNEKLNMLPHSFFINFSSLYVLDLSGSKIKSLPDSVIFLVELRVLILRRCKLLERIPHLKRLKKLQELDLSFTGIRELPNGIKRLDNLRVVNLSWTCLKGQFLNKVLESLPGLQCLRLEGCEGVQPDAIAQLEELETLYISFSDICSFASYLNTKHWRRLSQYRFTCGTLEHPAPADVPDKNLRTDVPDKNLRTVILFNCDSIGPSANEVPFILPTNVQRLEINNCSNLTSLSDLLQGFKGTSAECLTRLDRRVEDFFLSESNRVAEPAILNLEAFANLQSLTIVGCPRLKHLLASGLVEHLLRNLEYLRVRDCSNLVEIIATEDFSLATTSSSSQCSNQNAVFPRLRELVIHNLPNLNSIYRRTMVCQSIEEIEVVSIPMLKRLSFFMHEEGGQRSIALPPALKKIKGQKDWWDSLEPDSKDLIQSVFCTYSEE